MAEEASSSKAAREAPVQTVNNFYTTVNAGVYNESGQVTFNAANSQMNIGGSHVTEHRECLEDVFQDEIIKSFFNITSFMKFARSKIGLCLDEHILQQIVEDHEGSMEHQKLQVLNKWREITGEKATVSKIRYHLRKYLREDDGDYVVLENGIFGMYKNHVLCERSLVYLGEQTSEVTGSYICAIKLRQNNKENLREAKILSKLRNHVNVVRILHAGICRLGPVDYIYIAMDLSWTDTVRNMLEESNRQGIPFNEFISMNLVEQILRALNFIHSNNIIHRDLKPENVLVSKYRSQSKVTDFGISKTITDGHSTRQTNANIGTDAYRARESYITDAKITLKSDIFSAGITIAEISSNGKHPFGEDPYLWSHNIINNNNLNLSQLFVPQIMNLIKRMLETDPEKRPTAEKVLNEFQQYQTSSQPTNQQTTADQSSETSSITSSMTQLSSSTEKVNAIIMFNMKDKHMYSFKPETKKWSQMQEFSNVGYSDFTTVVSDIYQHIYILSNRVYQLEFSDSDLTAKWKQMSNMIEDHGYRPPAAVLNGLIYVCGIGGISGESKCVERYDADSNQWHRICDMNIARRIHCVVATKDHIYCMGGCDLQSVERFDEKLNKWEFVEPSPGPIHGSANAAVVKNRIYVVANYQKVLCYDIQKNSWSEMNLNLWPFIEDSDLKILAVNEELYIVGECKKKKLFSTKTVQRIYMLEPDMLEPETRQMTLVEKIGGKRTYYVAASLAVELFELTYYY